MPSPTAITAVFSVKACFSEGDRARAVAARPAGMEEPEVVAVAAASRAGRSEAMPCARTWPGPAGSRRASRSSASIGVHARPVALLELRLRGPLSESAKLGHARASTSRPRSAAQQRRARRIRPARGPAVAHRARQVGEVDEARGSRRPPRRASPRPCPRARRCRGPRASRLGRASSSRQTVRIPRRAKRVELVPEAVVAGPAPQQRHRARELDRLVGVARRRRWSRSRRVPSLTTSCTTLPLRRCRLGSRRAAPADGP